MSSFCNLLNKVTSSPYYEKMRRFVAPLYSYMGVNHFWYYKITAQGDYAYVGTHTKWNEFCFDHAHTALSTFPCLRHPKMVQAGLNLMKASSQENYRKILDIAWRKFQINFNINFVDKVPGGVEAFGFATCFNDVKAEERLLQNIYMLRTFAKMFKQQNEKLLRILEENRVNLPTQLGSIFYKPLEDAATLSKRELFLSQMGLESFLSLSSRELDILKFILHGYPASFISESLNLSKRTVESYLGSIKYKLACNSKVDLIEKAKIAHAFGLFDCL